MVLLEDTMFGRIADLCIVEARDEKTAAKKAITIMGPMPKDDHVLFFADFDKIKKDGWRFIV